MLYKNAGVVGWYFIVVFARSFMFELPFMLLISSVEMDAISHVLEYAKWKSKKWMNLSASQLSPAILAKRLGQINFSFQVNF